jgi:hypothetical protein
MSLLTLIQAPFRYFAGRARIRRRLNARWWS